MRPLPSAPGGSRLRPFRLRSQARPEEAAGLRAALLVGLVLSVARSPSACGLVSSLLCCKCGSLPIFFFILSYLTFHNPL